MDTSTIREWETSLDQAELSPLTANLPHSPVAGQVFEEVAIDATARKWVAVRVLGGSNGARWAYWAAWTIPNTEPRRFGVGPNPDFVVVVDKLFNGDAAHFVGMTGDPYVRVGDGRGGCIESIVWVLVEPRMSGPRVVKVRAEERIGERYEKSREIYDVETGETTEI